MQSLPPRPVPSAWRRRPSSPRRASPRGGSRARDTAADAIAVAVERARLIGPARVAATAATIVAVVAGTYWLVRPPQLPTEAALPFATATTRGPSATGGEATSTAVADAASAQVTVHVAGAVRAPGVYALPSSARVVDAVRAAGGLAADADADRINLAATLADGQRVYVPRVGEDDPLAGQLSPATGTTAPSGPVNLNSATASELETLPGIGPTTAAAIVAHRDQHGPFASVDELGEVAGIGPAKLAALRGLVTV